jgi:hypothetical protein
MGKHKQSGSMSVSLCPAHFITAALRISSSVFCRWAGVKQTGRMAVSGSVHCGGGIADAQGGAHVCAGWSKAHLPNTALDEDCPGEPDRGRAQ